MTKQIHQVLVGHPQYRIIGLIDRIEALEKTGRKHERKLLKATGILIGLTICWELIKKKLFGGE